MATTSHAGGLNNFGDIVESASCQRRLHQRLRLTCLVRLANRAVKLPSLAIRHRSSSTRSKTTASAGTLAFWTTT